MRLLFLSNVFPNPHEGTRGVFNLDMVRELARENEVRVISPISWVDEWRAERPARAGLLPGRRARVGGVDVHYPRFYYPPRFFREHYDRFLWLSVRRTVGRVLREFRPEAVLSYWVHPDGAVAVRAARAAGVPAVVMAGGSDVLLLTSDRARRRSVQRVLRAADAVVTVSQDLRAKVLDFGVAPGAVHVIQRGVDPEKFSPGDRAEARRRLGIPVEGRALVWVGRMVEVKGLDVLLDACDRLKARGVVFHLYLVGEGRLRPALEAEARVRGLAAAVTFAGARPHDQLADWYRAADRTVLPSRSEGVPNVLRESLACGTPFVASRVGGVPEVADGPPNRLVPPGDPAALAEAIDQALRGDDPPSLSRPCGVGPAVKALSRVIESLASSPRTRAPAGAGSRP